MHSSKVVKPRCTPDGHPCHPPTTASPGTFANPSRPRTLSRQKRVCKRVARFAILLWIYSHEYPDFFRAQRRYCQLISSVAFLGYTHTDHFEQSDSRLLIATSATSLQSPLTNYRIYILSFISR